MRARFSIVRPPDRTDRVHLIASGGERTPDNAGGDSCQPVGQANPPLTQPPPLNDGPRQAGALLRLRRGPPRSGGEGGPPPLPKAGGPPSRALGGEGGGPPRVRGTKPPRPVSGTAKTGGGEAREKG